MSAANRDTQNAVVQRQFDPAAADYVSSPVHARGPDLDHIAAIAAAQRPAHVVDLGTGGGHVAYAVAPHAGRVSACDLSSAMLGVVAAEATQRGLTNVIPVQAPAQALPFDRDSADMLVSRLSVHHWSDAAAGLAEARRVLRPGAPAVFVDVIAPGEAFADTHLQAVELLRDPSHGRDYRLAEWVAMLTTAGFAVTTITPGRLRMDFATWIERIRTPPAHVAAIRALQTLAPAEVAAHFAIERDGSFTIDTVMIEVT